MFHVHRKSVVEWRVEVEGAIADEEGHGVKVPHSSLSYALPPTAHWGSHLIETPGNKVT